MKNIIEIMKKILRALLKIFACALFGLVFLFYLFEYLNPALAGIVLISIPIIVVIFLFSNRPKRKIKKAFDDVQSFSPTHVFYNDSSKTGVAIDINKNKIAFSRIESNETYSPFKHNSKQKISKISVYNFDQLHSVETLTNEKSIYKTNTGNQVARGVVGGLLLGGAGLLIGALTGSKTKKEKISKISLKVGIKDIDNPNHEIIFYDSDPVNADSVVLGEWIKQADEWSQRISAILASKD
jgi:ABC-type multidrug transport system fused ATPase/permease subunit